MALYNPDNFAEDITTIFKIERSEADMLKDTILQTKVVKTMKWESFNEELKSKLTGFMVNRQHDFSLPTPDPDMKMKSVPKYDQANTFEDICAYLDAIKGNHIEDNLKRHILKSQTEEVKYNYFARIFDLWNHNNMKPKMKDAFLCCYAEVLLTQQLTQPMLNFIISTFAKVYKGGLDPSLNSQLSGDKNGGKIKYDQIEKRDSFLHLIYAITFVDSDDDKKISSKRSKEVLLSVLSQDDYNPRSFLDVTYYYAIINLLCFSELEKMLRDTAKLVILNLFGDNLSSAAESFSNNITLSKIESFLDFNLASIEAFQDYLQENYSDLKLDEKEAISIAERRMKEMKVNYFNDNVYDRETNTYDYSQASVEPKVEYMIPEKFCRWMAEERRFYESYYDIESKTRAETLYGYPIPETPSNETDYAYLIVHEGLLDFKIGNYSGIGSKFWKNRFRNIDEGQRIEKIEQFLKTNFDKITNELNNIEYKRDLSAIWTCMQFDTLELAKAVNDELKRKKAAAYDNAMVGRSEYLLTVFEEYCSQKKSAMSFELVLSETGDEDEDEQMEAKRWPFFSPLRYQDAMLYMCLNCNDPKEMFNRINNTPGYDYYQKK